MTHELPVLLGLAALLMLLALALRVHSKPQESVAGEQRRRRLENAAREQSWARTPFFPPGDEF